MKTVDMIVKAPHFYTMAGEGVGYKADMAMVVDTGKITDIMPAEKASESYAAEQVINLTHHMVLPGFVDAHMHTGDCILRGLAQDINNWMMFGLQPFNNPLTIDERNLGSQLAVIEGILAGTTTFGDYHRNMDFVAGFLDKVGVRGRLAHMIRAVKDKVYKPGELYEYDDDLGEKNLQVNLDLYDKWQGKGNGRITVMFGPQGADFMSKELLLKIQKIAKERKTKIHMHVQQGDRETIQVEMRYQKRPIAWLEEIGYLDDTLIAVHLADANAEEAAVVAKSGASMVVCPGSIGIIDGIVCPSMAFQEAGGNCALGSDQAPGNNCHNVINEMKNVALFNKIKTQNPETMPAWKALRMATIEGARALGLGDEIGSLEIGKKADFIAIDLMKPSMLPLYTNPMRNMVPNLVYSARGDEVVLSVVDGKVIMRDRKIIGIDEKEYLENINQHTARIGEAASKEFWDINGTNAAFMREEKL